MVSRAPINIRNNNPGNIRISNRVWPGKVAPAGDQSRKFEAFATPAHGVAAMTKLLQSYISKGFDTPAEIINRWAPPFENDTNEYIRFVCSRTGIHPNQNISAQNGQQLFGMIKAMIAKEGGPAASAYYDNNTVNSGIQIALQDQPRSGNIFTNAWDRFKGGMQAIGNTFNNAVQGTTQFFRGTYDNAARGLSNIGSAVSSFTRRAVNTVGLGAFMLGGSTAQVYPANFMGPIQQGASRAGEFNRQIKAGWDHRKYQWGGDSENDAGLDCSGFVKDVFGEIFKTEISRSSREQARSINSLFKLGALTRKSGSQITAADIPPHAVISIQRPGGGGHVIMVTQDEHGNTVTWDSQGGRRNTGGNLGRGVTQGSLEKLIGRLNREGGAAIEIVNTTRLFGDLKNGLPLTQQMLADAWQADLQTKQRTMAQTVQASGINAAGVMVNFTNQLGQQELINRSTFIVNAANGQRILNVAAGMSESWTKFSVVRHLAKAEGMDPGKALAQVAARDPAFAQFMMKPELQKLGYGKNFAGMVAREQMKMQGGQQVAYTPAAGGGRVNNEVELLRQQARLINERLDKLTQTPIEQPAPGQHTEVAQVNGPGFPA